MCGCDKRVGLSQEIKSFKSQLKRFSAINAIIFNRIGSFYGKSYYKSQQSYFTDFILYLLKSQQF